jgi:hypothetical protein
MVGAKVAFMATSGSVFSTPMQLGPTTRMPWRSAISISTLSRSTPAPPISRKPAVITTIAFTPASPHASATAAT